MSKRAYTTIGNVRRGCGHKHRTLRAARACLEQDYAVNGGCSDRTIVEIDASIDVRGVRVDWLLSHPGTQHVDM